MKSCKSRFALLAMTAMISISSAVNCGAQGPRDQEQPDMSVDATARKQVIEALAKNLEDRYVFPEVAKQMITAMRERMQKGEYDQVTSASAFAKVLTEHLRAVSHDKHVGVNYSAEPIDSHDPEAKPTETEREKARRFYNRINYGFEKLERMPGNIGYLNLRGFADPEFGADTVAAAMNFLANTDALVIDLRQNGGGEPAMVALVCSYLFGKDPVHLNDLYWRVGNRTQEFWTKASVPGKRYEGKDVYVLTSNHTFSGGEEFAYNVKNLKRATLIGETTGGGANPGGFQRITDHFGAFIPTGRAINPITKTNWEGTGVKPDVSVPAELALKTGYLMALTKLADKNTDEKVNKEYKRLIDQTQGELDQLKKQGK